MKKKIIIKMNLQKIKIWDFFIQLLKIYVICLFLLVKIQMKYKKLQNI